MTPIVFAVLLAVSGASASQVAASASPAPPAQTPKPASDPNKMVCHSEEQPGSRVRNRVCMTQAQWDQQQDQLRQYFQDISDRGGINSGGAANPMQPH